MSTCADVLGARFATTYLKSTYAKFREPEHDGWGFVRLVDQLLERQQESERTVSGLWKVHWQWSIENGQMARLPEYIDRATQWLGTDWRAEVLEDVDFSKPDTYCDGSAYPEMCRRKWIQLRDRENAQQQANNAPSAQLTLKTNGRGLVRCSADSMQFDGEMTLTVEGYQLPATCLLSMDEHKTVFQVFGSGTINCTVSVSDLVCDRDAVP